MANEYSAANYPATPAQTKLLLYLTGKDYRDEGLTRASAGRLIHSLIEAEKREKQAKRVGIWAQAENKRSK